MIKRWLGVHKINLEDDGWVYTDEESEKQIRDLLLFSKQKTQSFEADNLNELSFEITLSVVLVTFNSESWIPVIRESLIESKELINQVVIVDNGSTDQTLPMIEQLLPDAKVVQNVASQSLANGINIGLKNANGALIFIINPDVSFTREALIHLIQKAKSVDFREIVSPKIRLMTNPQFINSIGNFVGPFNWGYDGALGHLDVGQFDEITELNSACFAAVLIPRNIIDTVGFLDENYFMYYEDVDWCFQARLKGFSILFEPKAVVYHAFGGHQDKSVEISTFKLQQVTYSRLRLIKKFAIGKQYWFYLLSYILFDCIYSVYSLLKRNPGNVRAIIFAWKKFLSNQKINPGFDRTKGVPKLLLTPSVKFFPRIKYGIPVITKKMINGEKYL